MEVRGHHGAPPLPLDVAGAWGGEPLGFPPSLSPLAFLSHAYIKDLFHVYFGSAFWAATLSLSLPGNVPILVSGSSLSWTAKPCWIGESARVDTGGGIVLSILERDCSFSWEGLFFLAVIYSCGWVVHTYPREISANVLHQQSTSASVLVSSYLASS